MLQLHQFFLTTHAVAPPLEGDHLEESAVRLVSVDAIVRIITASWNTWLSNIRVFPDSRFFGQQLS